LRQQFFVLLWKLNATSFFLFTRAKRKGQIAWEEKYEELQRYMKAEGHCNVPTKHESNRALGRWVSTQRSIYKSYKAGKKQSLSELEIRRRIGLLEKMDFQWRMAAISSSDSSSWNEVSSEDLYIFKQW
jgi:hypothetical protein